MTAGSPALPVVPSEERLLGRFDAPKADTPTTLGVIADAHVSVLAHGTWKCYHRTERWLRRAVEHLNDRDVDCVLVPGDLTKDGEPWNFDRFDDLIAPLTAPVVAVPGNHDVPKAFDDHDALSLGAFEDRYGDLPFVTRVGGVTIVGLNTASLPDGALSDTWGGAVSAAQLSWLDEVLGNVDTDATVAALHHSLSTPEAVELPAEVAIRNRDEVLDVLDRHGVDLVISGHQHVPGATAVGGVSEVVAPSVCSFPHAILTVDVDQRGTRIWIRPVATAAERVEGHRSGTTDTDLSRRIVRLAERRLDRLPLVAE